MELCLLEKSAHTVGTHLKKQKDEITQQGVPVYDPQLVAMRWPFLAAKAYSTAVGRAWTLTLDP